MKVLVLKNGAEEPEELVIATWESLANLHESDPTAFYELVMKCRDENHRFCGNAAQPLRELRLLQEDGAIHDSIRNIVLSATEGNGLGMKLVSPA